MSNRSSKLTRYNPAVLLQDDEDIVAFLQAALDEEDSATFLVALGHAARAKGISDIAQLTGLGRESLYKSLNGAVEPRWSTVTKILKALDIRLELVA